MRTADDCQWAHDTIVGALLGEVPIELNRDERLELAAGVSGICWVLEHDHVELFPKMLANVQQRAEAVGYRLGSVPRCPAGQPVQPQHPAGLADLVKAYWAAERQAGEARRRMTDLATAIANAADRQDVSFEGFVVPVDGAMVFVRLLNPDGKLPWNVQISRIGVGK